MVALRIAALAVPLTAGLAHGEPTIRPFTVEAAVGFHSSHDDDAYLDTLGEFGYRREEGLFPDGHYDLAFAWRAHPHLELAAEIGTLSEDHWLRSRDSVPTSFDWQSHAAALVARGVMGDEGTSAFLEVGGGLAWASTDLSKGEDAHDRQTEVGRVVRAGVGFRMIGPWGLGWVMKLRRTWAPVMSNLYGERHDVGGTAFDVGVCYGW